MRRARAVMTRRRRLARRAEPRGDTRQRLLEAARSLFAERGFAKVTVRDITALAHANLAAVSYHFRDKMGLYKEVLQQGIEIARELNAETMLSREEHSPEERLRHYVYHYLPHIVRADKRVWFHRIMRHEMSDPTPAAQWYVEQSIMPRIEFLVEVIRDLLGEGATTARVNRCTASLQAQCLFWLPDPFKTAVFGDWQPSTDAAIREMAEHIADFSLAGIREIATQHPRRR
ncbi:MAG: TetR/AcrR family transcriptional regulator [Gemmatimonadaceae bacterium]